MPTSCQSVPLLDKALKLIDDLGVVLVYYQAALQKEKLIVFKDIVRGDCVLCRKCGLATELGKEARHQEKCELLKLDSLVKRTVTILTE